MENETKYKVISLLDNGQTPKDIADDLSIGYSSVLRIKKEYEEAKTNGNISQLLDVDRLLIEKTAESLDLPIESVEEVTKGLSGLDALSQDLQQTALAINKKVKELIIQAEHASELAVYAEILCDIQTAFINKNMTQVNVQNNFGEGANNSASRYSQYLSDVPGGV